MVGGHMKYCG